VYRQTPRRVNEGDEPLVTATAGDHGAYWITSSARSSSEGATVRPSAFAVLRLTMNSNFVGRSMGRSAGLAPLRIFPVKEPRRRYPSARLGPYAMRQPATAFSRNIEIVGSRLVTPRAAKRRPAPDTSGEESITMP